MLSGITGIDWGGMGVFIAALAAAVVTIIGALRRSKREIQTEIETNNMRVSASDTKLDSMQKVAKDTHTLVNSNMGVQLRLNAAVTKRLAELTKSPEDDEAAKLAQLLYDEHVQKQEVVDSGVATKAGPEEPPQPKEKP